MWTEAWRDANALMEAWTTPFRAANAEYAIEADNATDKSKAAAKESKDVPGSVDKEDSAKDNAVPVEESKKDDKLNNESAELSLSTTAALVNDLPVDERNSVYTYENNLGAPPGQTEMDSSNRAAATGVKHRPTAANFSFAVPLAALPGRGIDAGVGMTYNSRTWNKSCSQYDAYGNCNAGSEHFTYDVEKSWIAPGFSSGFGYLESSAEIRNVLTDPPNNDWHTEITPLGLTDSDGTRHQFTCTATVTIPGTQNNQQRCSVYSSNDGTRIQLNAKNYISNPGNQPTSNTSTYSTATWETTLPGGTKVWYSGGFGSGTSRRHYPFMIRDRNGNRLRIQYKADQSGRIDKIIDTLNREIKFYYENDTGGNPDKLIAVSIPGMDTGEIQTVRFYYESMTLASAGTFTGQITAPASIRVLRWVYMPATKTAYKYDYHPNYGMIKRIERRVGVEVSLPDSTTATGVVTDEGTWAASTEYSFPDGSTALSDAPKYDKRTDDWAGRTGSTAAETLYQVNESLNTTNITVKDAGFDVLTQTVADNGGMIQQSSVYRVSGGNSVLMARNAYTWDASRSLTALETTNNAGLKRKTEFDHDQYHNQTAIREYDLTSGSGTGALLRTTEIAYETGTGWINANLTGLAKSVKTIVGGVTVAKTLFEYDHNGNDSTLVHRGEMDGTHDTFFNPDRQPWTETICPLAGDGCVTVNHPGYSADSAYRGNVTKVSKMLDVSAATPDANRDDVTEIEYDILGNVVSSTLSCCQVRTYEYDPTSFAYQISQTSGSSPQLTTLASYNMNTGLLVTSTDENGQMTSYEYEEDTLRPRKVIHPNGGYTLTEYSDKLVSGADLVPGFVRQTTQLDTNKFAQSYSYFDGRGLTLRTASQSPDGWSVSAVEYDNLGRARKSYNPFNGTTPTAAIPAGTKYSEVTAIDALGRTTGVKLQDDTTVSTAFSDLATTPNGFLKTFVTVTDQAGKKRRQVTDALGRIVRVDEPDANGSLGAVDASLPAQQTGYEYDGNDNLTKVIQSDGSVVQERKFKYDALSRLVAEKQVEASATLDINGVKGTPDPATKWTKVLKYNPKGLLTDGYDARGVRTQFAYDGLNRVTGVTYSGETGYQTPGVTYTYDQARTGFYNTGALTRVETAAVGDTPATATEFDYDQMGQVRKHRQWIAGQQYDLEYTYNLAGQLVSEKYPSGRVVTNSYDANGRLSGVSDASRAYLSNLTYQGLGGSLSSMTFGNAAVQTFALNDRLQMANQTLSKGSEVLQKYDYGYGQIDASGNLDTTKNNGRLGKIESYIGGAKQWTQKFSYDHIGRLKQSEERRGDTNAVTYKQAFDFDRFGNMYRKAASNPTSGQENPLLYTPIEDGDISKSTNRFTASTTYDDAGNVISDDKFRALGFGYDANGRMVKATKASTPDALSVYDASGLRVAEKVNDVWRFIVYDIGGKLVAEYGGPQSNDEGGVKYLLSDWQGSTRAIVSNSGFVNGRADYTAFGEEIGSGTGLRTAAQGFGSTSSLRQKYGLTERDDATGLDHTWFRKHENRAGRWTSPDPYNGSMSIGNPQSFNRFTYVANDPTNFVDPSGLLRIQECTRTWVDYGNGRQYSAWTCITIYDDGGGSVFGESTGASNPPDNKSDCEKFVDLLVQAVEERKDNFAAKAAIGTHLASLSWNYLSIAKVPVTGFFDRLVAGGQDNDVYRHVTGAASSILLDGLGLVSAADSLRQDINIWRDSRTDEARASKEGNRAGEIVGGLIAGRLDGFLKSATELRDKIKDVLCKK